MANSGNCNPFINIVFLTDTKIFVALFYNKEQMHYHFIYDLANRNHTYRDNEIYKFHIENTSIENFPIKSIIDTDSKKVMCFYRLGQVITTEYDNICKDVFFENLDDHDVGSVFLYNCKALIVRNSSSVLFYKRVYQKSLDKSFWKKYHQFDKRGSIYSFID